MKRKIALLLAAVMTLTMIPTVAMAAVSVTNPKTTNSDTEYGAAVVDTAPTVGVETTKEIKTAPAATAATFSVTLDGDAEFLNEYAGIEAYISGSPDDVPVGTITRITTKEILVTLNLDTTGAALPGGTAVTIPKDTIIYVPMLVGEFDEPGSIRAVVDNEGDNLSSGSVTIVTIVDGAVRVTSKKATIQDRNSDLETITIQELVDGTYDIADGNTITVRLPANYEFKNTETGNIAGLNVLLNGTTLTKGTDYTAAYGTGSTDREVIISLTADFVTANADLVNGRRDTFQLAGLTVEPSSSAKFGELTATVGGTVLGKSHKLVIGAYEDYGVTLEAEDEDLPTIYAGYYLEDGSDLFENETLEFTLEEVLDTSMYPNRKLQFEFPEGVEVIQFIPVENDGLSSAGITTFEDTDSYDIDDNIVTLTLGGDARAGNDTISLTYQAVVSVEPGFEGDITVAAKGPALLGATDLEVVVAKAVTPLVVSAKVTDIEIGYKEVEINDITIEEKEPGVLRNTSAFRTTAGAIVNTEGNSPDVGEADLVIAIGDLITNDRNEFRISGTPKVEVTKGDLEIDSVRVRNGQLLINFDVESEEASTIKITGLKVNIDRTPAEGKYALAYTGSSVITNYSDDDDDDQGFFDVAEYILKGAYNVITPAPGSTSQTRAEAKITFVDGSSSSILVGDKVLEANSYIQNGRTLVSLRAVANALGVAANDVGWDSVTRTASIKTQSGIASVKVAGWSAAGYVEESSTLYLNGVPFGTMSQVPTIINDMVYLPIADFAKALNISFLWDQETRTVVFNPSADTIAAYPNATLNLTSDQDATVSQNVVTDDDVADTVSSEDEGDDDEE